MSRFDDQFRGTFETIAESRDFGVPGVLHITGPEPGPHVGLCAMTHGNEAAGLGAFAFLLHQQWLHRHLKTGSVSLMINNLEAGSAYFASREDCRIHYRYLDRDMNRLPHDLSEPSELNEVRRAQALQPVLQRLTHALDIHSTTSDSQPMLIDVDDSPTIAGLPGFEIRIRNLIPFLHGRPIIDLCSGSDRLVVECGSHQRPETFATARQAVLCLLAQWGVIDPALAPSPQSPQAVYQVFQGISFPDASYTMTHIPEPFQAIPAGAVLATGEGPAIRAPRDCHAVMPPVKLRPAHAHCDFMYLAERVSPV
jgi:hypothetical protein